jgi:hypothetical protein
MPIQGDDDYHINLLKRVGGLIMFNIQMGSSNSAQMALAKFKLKKDSHELSTLYGSFNDIEAILAFVYDIRNMPDDEFADVIYNIEIESKI